MAVANQHTKSARSSDTTKQKLSHIGITKDQSSKWQRLADVPEEEFEERLKAPIPSTTSILQSSDVMEITKANGETTPMDPDALWLWGMLRDGQRLGIMERDPAELVPELPVVLQNHISTTVPEFARWLNAFDMSNQEWSRNNG